MKFLILVTLLISSSRSFATLKDCIDSANASVLVPWRVGPTTYNSAGEFTEFDCDFSGTGSGAYSYCGSCNVYYDNTNSPLFPLPPSENNPACANGSIIQLDKLSLGESVEIAGTSETLTYMSSRVPGRIADYTFTLPLVGSTLDPSIDHFVVEVSVAGQYHSATISPSTNLNYDFTWDGNDNSGNPVMGAAVATISKHVYYNTGTYPDVPEVHTETLGSFRAQLLGLGGMTLSSVHFYDSVASVIHFGNGFYHDAPIIQVTVDSFGNVQNVTGSSSFDYYMVVNRDQNEAYFFDQTGRHVQTRSIRSGAILKTITYDGSGRLTSVADSYGQTINVTRPSSSSIVITAPYSQTTTLNLASGWTTAIIDPLSHSHSFTYGTGGLLLAYSPPNGGTSSISYDSNGLLSGESHSSGSSLTFATSVLPSGPGGQGMVTTTMTTNLGLTSTYRLAYTGNGHTMRGETESNGDYNSYEYTAGYFSEYHPTVGLHTQKYVSPDDRFSYAAPYDHNWTKMLGSSYLTGLTTISSTFSTSSLLQLTGDSESTAIGGVNWTRSFSLSTGTDTFTSPLGRTVGVTYNSVNQVTQLAPPIGSAINIAYDTSGRLSTVTQSSRQTTYAYDTAGNIHTITDPLLQVTTYGYDSAGHLTSTTLPDTRVINYSYDANGNLTTVRTPATVNHGLTYNLYDLIASYVAPTLSSTTYTTSYTYDNDKRLTQITRPDSSTLQFTYGSTYGTLTSLIAPEGTYSYSFSGKRLSTVTSPGSVTNAFTWDGPNVTTAATTWGSFSPQVTHAYANLHLTGDTFTPTSGSSTSISYSYNDDRLLVGAGDLSLTRTASTGLVSQSTLGSVTENFSYNSTYGEVSQYTANYSGTPFFDRVYTRDLLGRISQVAETVGGTTTSYAYGYDSAGRLHTVTIGGTLARTYNHSSNSNRSSLVTSGGTTSATYDDQDRILTYGTWSFTHNALGERTGRTDSASSEAFTYAFNSKGAMTQMTHTYPSGGSTATDTYDYTSDALGRRIEAYKNSTLQNRYLYDEFGRLVAELDSSGNFLSIFVYATMSNAPDFMIQSGTEYKLVHDHLGSVRRVVDSSSGSVVSSIDYDEFGKIVASSSLGVQPFGFAGGIRDDVTGFVRFGARDYDPETGQWLNKDPIGFAGGDTNLYGYTLGDPVNFLDPSGLDMEGIGAGATGGAMSGGIFGYVVGGKRGAELGVVYGALFGGFIGDILSRPTHAETQAPAPPRSEPPILPTSVFPTDGGHIQCP